ncbi:MAG: substrate-binding domain-containing protein [Gammaproteobacteria bacterium]|nr:substrate-binding domain-containing protein [Gammaproteobacteria bacterium]
MPFFHRTTICLSILLGFTVTPLSYAEATRSLIAEAFSDPDYIANPKKGFLEKTIQYDKKVADDIDVVISLGQQTYPAIHEIVEQIAKENGIKVAIQQGTCGATAKKLLNKSVDIATYCCPPGKTDRLPGLKFHTVAIAPVALVTHVDNPINNVSTEDAKKIFKGEYVSWSEVPDYQNLSDKLKGKTIQPVVRLHCKKRPGHWRLLLNSPDDVSPRAASVGTIVDMISQVSSNVTAIGYETPYMLKVHKDKGALKILSIDKKQPEDLKILLAGDYPVYRTYNLTTWANDNNKNEKAELLMDAIYDYMQKHGEQYGFIPAEKLKLAGWKFKGSELIAGPDGQNVVSDH